MRQRTCGDRGAGDFPAGPPRWGRRSPSRAGTGQDLLSVLSAKELYSHCPGPETSTSRCGPSSTTTCNLCYLSISPHMPPSPCMCVTYSRGFHQLQTRLPVGGWLRTQGSALLPHWDSHLARMGGAGGGRLCLRLLVGWSRGSAGAGVWISWSRQCRQFPLR